jgi:hypothetical protein
MQLEATTLWPAGRFFEAMKALLPLDPPLVGNRSWDALSDSLWSGLDQLAADNIAIVWPSVRFGIFTET